MCFGAIVEAGRVAEVTFFVLGGSMGSISTCQNKGLGVGQVEMQFEIAESP